MKRSLFFELSELLFLLCILASPSQAADAFSGLTCKDDFAKKLVGRKDINIPAVQIEAAHKDLQLKDLGADEVNDNLSLIWWGACNREVMVLEDSKNFVQDAVNLSLGPNGERALIDFCIDRTKPSLDAETIVVLLRQEMSSKNMTVLQAWKVDEKKKRIVVVLPETLHCSENYLIPK